MTTRIVGDDEFPKCIAVAAGPSECGKTRALEDLFLLHAPRRLSLDLNGEVKGKHPDAIEVYSIAELREQLAAVVDRERWHIALCTSAERLADMSPELARIFNPEKTSAQHISYPREVGGVAIDCSEARAWVPNLKAKWAQHNVAYFERGRHNRLSLFVATQYPQSVDRRVTDNASYLLAFRTQEDAVWEYWQRSTSRTVADLIAALPQYHCAYIDKDAQLVYLLDDERETYRVLDYKGADVAESDTGANDTAASDAPAEIGGEVGDGAAVARSGTSGAPRSTTRARNA